LFILMRIVPVLLAVATMVAAGLVLVGQLGRWSHLLDQFNALLPLLLVCLGGALAAAAGLRDRATVAVALLGLVVGGIQLGPEAIAGRAKGKVGHAVRVLSFSTFHANPFPEALRTAIVAEKPDVVLLQEADGNARAVVETLLPGYFRIKSCPWRNCHLVILSRWPIREVPVRFAGRGPHPTVVLGEVRAPFGTFRVLNVHLPRPYKPEAWPTMATLADATEAMVQRPLVMVGDFNSASGSFDLARFARRARLHRHDGLIPSYPANRKIPAFAGIDHVFADSRWSGCGCHRVDGAHSDHHGVACDLQLLSGG
jgi:endonuclease/exonuclease/phosphatase (EEP) superfamily protein YafD